MTPTVSVIIPCYNGGTTIGETLESLQKQTFDDWEAIVVNDGSTDNSMEIIHKYQAQDSRIVQIDQENQGLPGARNSGLAVARGEYVNFLDADDLLLPNMLQNTVCKLRDNPSLAAVYCSWIFSDAYVKDMSWIVSVKYEGQIFPTLAHKNLFPCHSILLRRMVLENVGIFDCSLRHCHDWDHWLRVARAGGRFVCVSTPLVIYRMAPESMSRNPFTFFKAGKEVIRRGHNSDPRVKIPAAEFAQGCNCPMKEVILEWCIHCVGFAIGQGDAVQASQLFETCLEGGDFHVTPKMMGAIVNVLWFAAAIPQGHWEALWPRISRPLLEFLLRAEEHLETPGFAMQCLLEIIGWRKPKPMSDRELPSTCSVRAAVFYRRLFHRLLRLCKSPY